MTALVYVPPFAGARVAAIRWQEKGRLVSSASHLASALAERLDAPSLARHSVEAHIATVISHIDSSLCDVLFVNKPFRRVVLGLFVPPSILAARWAEESTFDRRQYYAGAVDEAYQTLRRRGVTLVTTETNFAADMKIRPYLEGRFSKLPAEKRDLSIKLGFRVAKLPDIPGSEGDSHG